MPIDYSALMARRFSLVRQDYTPRDTMLYALGVGAGGDPMDLTDLRYVSEERLVALPTMAAVLCSPGFWPMEPDSGIDWTMVLHAEHSVTIRRPLATSGTLVARQVIDEVIDKGAGRGAIIYQHRDLLDPATDEIVAVVSQSSFVRGAGGFGGPQGPLKPTHPAPARAPDQVVDLPTRPDAALLYRLSGDYNPLHADPAVARAAGFDRPILHGLCTYGVAGRAIVRAVCADQPERLVHLETRFSAPVIPGQTIRTEIWNVDDGRVAFRCRVVESGTLVLDNGLALVI